MTAVPDDQLVLVQVLVLHSTVVLQSESVRTEIFLKQHQ